jgi:hypothetical protein
MGRLFIPQVIYEHGEPWWNDINRGKLLICPQELSGSPLTESFGRKQEEWVKGMRIWPHKVFLFILVISYMP